MNNIVASSSHLSTTAKRNTIAIVADNQIKRGHLTASQIAAAKNQSKNCTADDPCNTPNCKRCSSRVYNTQTNTTSELITTASCNGSSVFAVTIVSRQWDFQPPYDLAAYISDTNYFVNILRTCIKLRWTLHHDLAINSETIQPHIHGTIVGESAEDIRSELEECLELSGVSVFDIDIQKLSNDSPLQPVSDSTASSWSKYQNKMQHLNLNSCRTAEDINTILTLRVLSNTLFCDIPTYFSNYKPADPFPYILREKIAAACPAIASYGFADLANRLELDSNQVSTNSEIFSRIQRIRLTDNDVVRIRKAISRCISTDGSPFTKKLLLCLLVHGAIQTNNKTALQKLDGYWPTPATSLNQRHLWARWLDLLLA